MTNWNFKFEMGARAAFVIGACLVALAAVVKGEPHLAFWAITLAALIAL